MDLEKTKNTLQIWQIAKINLRHNFLLHMILALTIILLTPVLFGISNLSTAASAVPLEMFVPLIGVVMLAPVFQPEYNSQIRDVVASKYVSSLLVNIIRIVYSLISIVVITGLLSIFMKISECAITPSLVLGSIANAMFLGALGVFTASFTSNIAVSYMIPMIYYMLNFSGSSQFGHFYLFSMMRGEYEQKLWLFGMSVFLMVHAILLKFVVNKLR